MDQTLSEANSERASRERAFEFATRQLAADSTKLGHTPDLEELQITEKEAWGEWVEHFVERLSNDNADEQFVDLVNDITMYSKRINEPMESFITPSAREVASQTQGLAHLMNHTLLTYACVMDKPNIVSKLLELKADPSKKDASGFPPVMLAATKARNPAIVEMLLEHGASIREEWFPNVDGQELRPGLTCADKLYMDERFWDIDEKAPDVERHSVWWLLRFLARKEFEETATMTDEKIDYDPDFDILDFYREVLNSASEFATDAQVLLKDLTEENVGMFMDRVDTLKQHEVDVVRIYESIFNGENLDPNIDLEMFKRFVKYSSVKEQYIHSKARYEAVYNRVRFAVDWSSRHADPWNVQRNNFEVKLAMWKDIQIPEKMSTYLEKYSVTRDKFVQPFLLEDLTVIDVMPQLYENRIRLFEILSKFVGDQGKVIDGGVKGLVRIWQKMGESKNQDIWDLCRCMITYKRLSDITNAVDGLLISEELDVVSVNNRIFEQDDQIPDAPQKWQDLTIHVILLNQPFLMVSEVQLCLEDYVFERKLRGGHNAYSAFRLAYTVCRKHHIDLEGYTDPFWLVELEEIAAERREEELKNAPNLVTKIAQERANNV